MLTKFNDIKTKITKRVLIGYIPLLSKSKEVTIFPINKAIMIFSIMLFFALAIFATEYLPFNEEVGCYFLYFFCFFMYRIFMLDRNFKDYFVEHINDIS